MEREQEKCETTVTQHFHQFQTGAVRSTDVDSLAYELISPIGLRRVAETCEEGRKKYGEYNWEKGMPISDLLRHAIAHIYKYLFGDRSEDHLAHAAWNLLAACHSEEMWPTLNVDLRINGTPPRKNTENKREKDVLGSTN